MLLPFFLVGPTAVGKSSLAVEIAERCGAEIVGADAFQVYRGLDILTAKPSEEQLRRVPHHLVGVLPLAAEYNVARYLDDARRCLAAIVARGKSAIIVGGSGLYIRALSHGLSPLPPAQEALRAELDLLDLPALITRLRASDPGAIEVIDAKNKRRLVRAIEICETTGEPWSASRTQWREAERPPGAAHGLFLMRDRAELNARIARRVQAMAAAGLLTEVSDVQNETFSLTSSKILGLADVQAYRRGEMPLENCLAHIELATRQYAKRQMTWFRNRSDFQSVNLSQTSDSEIVAKAISMIQLGAE